MSGFSMIFIVTQNQELDMKAIVKTTIVAASAALIASVSASGWAQQQPGITPAPQTTPAQPGPGMGQQQMQRGMEHEKAGQGMGGQMMQQGREHAPMGPGMMQQQQPGTAQQPAPGTPPATTK